MVFWNTQTVDNILNIFFIFTVFALIVIAMLLIVMLLLWQKKSILKIYKKLFPNKINSANGQPSGLKNPSNHCYMNAIIQAAASSDKLIDQLKVLIIKYEQLASLKCFLGVLLSVNKFDDSLQHLCDNTDKLNELMKMVNWTKPNQQDAFELFATLIKEIHDEFEAQGIGNSEMLLKSKLVYRFKGMNLTDRMQYHIGLSLGLCGEYSTKPGVGLEFLIEEHFSPTKIDGDPNKTSQLFFLENVPEILLIHIQANKWNETSQKMTKPKYHIKYEKEMTIWLNIILEMDKEKVKQVSVTYRLSAVVQHTGTIYRGHYTTYRKWNDSWYFVSDDHVEPIKFKENICPYIMIYEKIKIEE